MQKKTNWQVWLILALGIWLAAGRPGLNVLPGGAPFPADKLSVLIVRESQARLNNDQFAVVNSQALRAVPQFRVYDPNQSPDKDAPWVAAALAAAKTVPPPSLTISNGRSGATVPLPANEAELQAIITKYGG